MQADVADRAQVEAMFATVDRELGTITTLINNAGVVGPERDIADVDAEFLRRIFATNVDGIFHCVGAAVFLASPKASYIHGTTIDVTGGR